MRYISLFSGIEAASVAWEPLGWEAISFSEIEPFCCELLNKHYPNVPNLGDIAKIDWRTYAGKVDVVVGGSPCQAFSVAGKRRGLLDARGRLMLEYIRAVREIRPEWVLWENVPGVLSQSEGDAFETLLGELEQCGYSLAWRVLDAQFFGVAQRRRRVFVVGHSRAGCAAAVLFERESLRWDSKTSREKRKSLTAKAGSGAETENAGIVCVSDDTSNASIDTELSGDLKVCGAMPYIVPENCLNAWDVQSKRVFDADRIAPTLNSGANEGKNIVPSVCYAIDDDIIGRERLTFYSGSGISDNLRFTLDTGKPFGVCYALQSNIIARGENAEANGKGVSNNLGYTLDTGEPFGVCYRESLRRLTPVECERLQGFPDNYTKIDETTSDTPRYRALGNSMAVPVMQWIGERIQKVGKIYAATDNR